MTELMAEGPGNFQISIQLLLVKAKIWWYHLQMANFAATIANKGYYIIPHLVKGIGETGKPLPKYTEKHYTTIDSTYFRVAADAMQEVVESGTGSYRGKLQDVIVCGKTGSVQNEPQALITLSLLLMRRRKIQRSLFRCTWNFQDKVRRAAASIATLMIEKYLYGATKRPQIEEYVLRGKFLN